MAHASQGGMDGSLDAMKRGKIREREREREGKRNHRHALGEKEILYLARGMVELVLVLGLAPAA